MSENYRVGIAGASTLAGKEVAEVLGESQFAAAEFVLLDEADAVGKLEAAGDEALVIQEIDKESFERMDYVFFAGDAGLTRKHWQSARRSGAAIVDMTYAMESEKDVLVMAPWVTEAMGGARAKGPDLRTPGVVAGHPAAVMLALVAARLQASFKLRSLAATVMEPASEHGRVAMDELHHQTVSLLSFQALPKEQYDAQVAFNVLPSLGDAAKVRLAAAEQRIREHYVVLGEGRLPELALQLAQAPVFHGYVATVMMELEEAASQEQIEIALQGEHLDVVLGEGDAPTNVSASGQEDILARVRVEPPGSMEAKRFWVWLGADNLKIAAQNAVACAMELKRLRPQGIVQ